jgi:hypothetical protein
MTLSQLTLVSAGIVVQALTFALGLVVGVSLLRKESNDDRDYRKEAQEFWHSHANRLAEKGPGCGAGRCSKPQPEADPVERFAGKRRDHGE